MNNSAFHKGSTSPPDPDDLVELGLVGRAQGLRGEVRVHLFDVGQAEIERLPTKQLYFKSPNTNELRELRFTEFRFHRGIWIISLEGICDRDAAEQLRGAIVCVRENDLWEPEEDEFFEFELVGLAAFDQKSGEKLGDVSGLRQIDADSLVVVLQPDGHEFLIPATWSIIKRIDLEEQVMEIDPPEGLIDLNRPSPKQKRKPKDSSKSE